ncbi:MAG TPA: type I 3-dehydroquinate dehydratase [Syntrophales bacterium]|nr:type I 3-dehydroquinate dehydratase [Syntrophobacterales bacterium]HRT26850.1 type I 3-dehydroquinate dehydratase [Syntrophales bacterium]HRT70386.1 type I 3-dehydroquinate dehydratase [Syntrophales bacterium]
MRICVSIMAGSSDEALAKMETALTRADLVELRVDRIKNPDLGRLLAGRNKKVVVTNRRREEGGSFQGTENERMELLREAVCLGAGYVDVEAATGPLHIRELAEMIGDRGVTKLIISHHNQTGTPGEGVLQKTIGVCRSLGADIVKVVTTARTPEDNLKVLRLIPYARRKGLEIIAFCMGDKGRISRVASPILGSFLSFASLERGEESAPGQMTVDEMRLVLSLLYTA